MDESDGASWARHPLMMSYRGKGKAYSSDDNTQWQVKLQQQQVQGCCKVVNTPATDCAVQLARQDNI
eukprot:scaffold4235_cov32-Tisochrysis_lutea.AAC.2